MNSRLSCAATTGAPLAGNRDETQCVVSRLAPDLAVVLKHRTGKPGQRPDGLTLRLSDRAMHLLSMPSGVDIVRASSTF